MRLPFKKIRRCRQTSSFVKKRLQQELPAVASCTARVAGRTHRLGMLSGAAQVEADDRDESYLVDPASSHMLVSKIKPCMSKYKLLYCETANGSLNQLSSI